MNNIKKNNTNGIPWPNLIPGTLIQRYKRFLADITLESGEEVTAHCPNSGKMTTCADPGMPVYISFHDNPKRKLKYTWELIDMPTSLVGVNTNVPNRLVKKAIEDGEISELSEYATVQSEVKVSEKSRLDLFMTGNGSVRDCYVEVKNCTLVENGHASFPDAVTSRGLKHLVELQRLAEEGSRCVMFYLIQRMDAKSFTPADLIDPAYGKELRRAYENGVEIFVYDVTITLEQIVINRNVPYSL